MIACFWSSTAMSRAGICPAAVSNPVRRLLDALRRELAEEGCIEVLGEPILHGMFFNSHVSRRDHVAVYLIRNFRARPVARTEP